MTDGELFGRVGGEVSISHLSIGRSPHGDVAVFIDKELKVGVDLGLRVGLSLGLVTLLRFRFLSVVFRTFPFTFPRGRFRIGIGIGIGNDGIDKENSK